MSATTTATAQDVADYLNGLPHTSAAPVLVRIGRTEYVGAIYTQERDTHEGTRAYSEGERTYSQQAVYLLGDLPASYKRSTHTAYRLGNQRWYVGGYFPHAEPNEWHPFGRMFQLMPDTHDVTRDDDGNPYDERAAEIIRY